MKRFVIVNGAALAAACWVSQSALTPVSGAAQTTLAVGGGVTVPSGDYGDRSSYGRHAMAGLRVGVPAFPVAARFEALYHRIPGKVGETNDETMVAGKISAVFSIGLPVGPGLYFLGGLGRYRTTQDSSASASSQNGAHGGLGGRFRLLGLGLFAEGQVINRFQATGEGFRHVTVTAGFEF